MPTPQKTISPFRLVLAWMVVGIPLVWGIWNTFQKALALFITK